MPSLVATWVTRVLVVAVCVLVSATLSANGWDKGVLGGLVGLAFLPIGVGRIRTAESRSFTSSPHPANPYTSRAQERVALFGCTPGCTLDT
jgi:hypothetical protein